MKIFPLILIVTSTLACELICVAASSAAPDGSKAARLLGPTRESEQRQQPAGSAIAGGVPLRQLEVERVETDAGTVVYLLDAEASEARPLQLTVLFAPDSSEAVVIREETFTRPEDVSVLIPKGLYEHGAVMLVTSCAGKPMGLAVGNRVSPQLICVAYQQQNADGSCDIMLLCVFASNHAFAGLWDIGDC